MAPSYRQIWKDHVEIVRRDLENDKEGEVRYMVLPKKRLYTTGFTKASWDFAYCRTWD